MRVEVAARIQAHPSRADLRPALLERLAPLPTEVVEHSSDPPSPWAGYLRCLTDPPDSSHLLIIQDDACPVQNFAAALHQIAGTCKETPVSLFLAKLPRDASLLATRAMKHNPRQRYITFNWRSFLPVVATLWPREKAVEFLSWAHDNPTLPGQREPRSDDAMAGRWKMVTRQTVLATVPSIVEHPDMEPSLIGRRRSWGQDSGRVALFLADDALDYDWTVR